MIYLDLGHRNLTFVHHSKTKLRLQLLALQQCFSREVYKLSCSLKPFIAGESTTRARHLSLRWIRTQWSWMTDELKGTLFPRPLLRNRHQLWMRIRNKISCRFNNQRQLSGIILFFSNEYSRKIRSIIQGRSQIHWFTCKTEIKAW